MIVPPTITLKSITANTTPTTLQIDNCKHDYFTNRNCKLDYATNTIVPPTSKLLTTNTIVPYRRRYLIMQIAISEIKLPKISKPTVLKFKQET